MADAAEDNADQSMEEILQSIKRIIADEEDEEPSADAADDAASIDDVDVLELTEMVKEGDKAESAEPEAKEEAMTDTDDTADDEVDIDALFGGSSHETDDAEEKTEPDVQPSGIENLVSDEVAKAAASAMSSIPKVSSDAPIPTTPSMHMRTGATVEDLVIESLKPMLKEWLDANLQTIVERTVEREVRRISGQ